MAISSTTYHLIQLKSTLMVLFIVTAKLKLLFSSGEREGVGTWGHHHPMWTTLILKETKIIWNSLFFLFLYLLDKIKNHW